MKRLGYWLFISFTFITGCKQDLDLTAPYKETPVVYGLLNYSEPTHYIRIQKGYLIDGNAYAASGVPDSIYYSDSLSVKLIPYYNGNQSGQTLILHRTTLPKDSGTFASSDNVVYAVSGNLDPNKKYKLEVTNLSNGYTFSSKGLDGISLVNDFTIVTPPYRGYRMALQTFNPTKVVWYAADNAVIYDLKVRFPYKEYDLQTNTLLADTFVDVMMFSNKSTADEGGVSLYEDFSGYNILNALHNSLAVNAGRYRVFNDQKGMTLYFSAGGQDLANYINTQNAQQLGISSNEALPPYTNIAGGYGVFSTRYTKQIDSILLTPAALDTLACSPLTNGLNFKDANSQFCQ